MAKVTVNNTELSVVLGDITEQSTDAIVNAANNHLWMGSGVAGAIKRRGGEAIEREALRLGPIPVGEAVVTMAGSLPASYVIHAAGMGQDLRTDGHKLMLATKNSLFRAQELGLESVSFPAIGTGVGGFPVEEAALVMVSAAREHALGETTLKRIVFCLLDEAGYAAFKRALMEGEK